MVENKLQEVSDRTLEKLREMNPDIANRLNPVIRSAQSLKRVVVFKSVSISGDNDIPINKNSDIKRLILLNFFRAEAERRKEILEVLFMRLRSQKLLGTQ